MKKNNKFLILKTLILACFLFACEADVANVVGTSSSGLIIGIKAIGGNSGLPADGISQATIRVEVFTADGLTVSDETITLTTTLGTLADVTLTVDDGVAITTLTSSTVVGTAFIVASVENVSATASIEIVNISEKAA